MLGKRTSTRYYLKKFQNNLVFFDKNRAESNKTTMWTWNILFLVSNVCNIDCRQRWVHWSFHFTSFHIVCDANDTKYRLKKSKSQYKFLQVISQLNKSLWKKERHEKFSLIDVLLTTHACGVKCDKRHCVTESMEKKNNFLSAYQYAVSLITLIMSEKGKKQQWNTKTATCS